MHESKNCGGEFIVLLLAVLPGCGRGAVTDEAVQPQADTAAEAAAEAAPEAAAEDSGDAAIFVTGENYPLSVEGLPRL